MATHRQNKRCVILGATGRVGQLVVPALRDISPETPLGQFIASLIMIMGYGIIAVPTGIVTAEYTKADRDVETNTQVCENCNNSHHKDSAKYCHNCGHSLHIGL